MVRRRTRPLVTTMPEAHRFDPHVHGFPFTNRWPHQPAVRVWTPWGRLPVGDAARGLCGGMVFAAADYFHAQLPAPARRPDPEHPLYRYLVRRLVDSWLPPRGAAGYYIGMLREDTALARRTMAGEWPVIARSLGRGRPVILGLVTARGADPRLLPRNHQVLAYRFDADADSDVGEGATRHRVWVYDPNLGADTAGVIVFDTAHPERGFAHTLGVAHPVRGFFRVGYTPRRPPVTAG
ncbi:hypothetical protein J4H86_01730 [Spiractinospora alimapuensis]|uniref:hypothetical protein n=1 Tax=Spiractinospora alimapuensis TaxID=2820884 RepID=UPI001F2F8BFA|nr:hypothetical protein [Spiractinospora alimapuensis]QVQ52586.1 hypothetical protein J4H86_01730 [Spiractinospora alimapuensis]